MKIIRLVNRLGLAAALLLTLPGCAALPTQEMSDARQALQAARDDGAAIHTPHKLEWAQGLLDEATQALVHGHYDEARNKAVAAREAAFMVRSKTLQLQGSR